MKLLNFVYETRAETCVSALVIVFRLDRIMQVSAKHIHRTTPERFPSIRTKNRFLHRIPRASATAQHYYRRNRPCRTA